MSARPDVFITTREDDGTHTFNDPLINVFSKFYHTGDTLPNLMQGIYDSKKVYQKVTNVHVSRNAKEIHAPNPDYVDLDRIVSTGAIPKKEYFTELSSAFGKGSKEDFIAITDTGTGSDLEIPKMPVVRIIFDIISTFEDSPSGIGDDDFSILYAEALGEPLSWVNLWKYRSVHSGYVWKRMTRIFYLTIQHAETKAQGDADDDESVDDNNRPSLKDFTTTPYSDMVKTLSKLCWMCAQGPIIMQHPVPQVFECISNSSRTRRLLD